VLTFLKARFIVARCKTFQSTMYLKYLPTGTVLTTVVNG